MQILDSTWLINMIEKSGTSPEARLLAAFDILTDWLEAPSIKENLTQSVEANTAPKLLLSYLSNQAKTTKAAMPEMLAEQMIFLLSSAIQAHLHGNHQALQHAKQAAQALIKAQCEKEKLTFSINKKLYAIAAGFALIALIGGAFLIQQPNAIPIVNSQNANPNIIADDEAIANPKHTADLYASIETMRGGDCQFIEALQIPDADKKIYLENVVAGQVPTNAHDQMIAQKYMQKIRCNYTPMLMKNSTN